MKFTTHVASVIGIPIKGEDYVIYRPAHTIKLESDRITKYNSKVSIESCEKNGHVEVSVIEKYQGSIKILNSKVEPFDREPIVLQLLNVSEKFIRIEDDEHLFVFTYKKDDVVEEPVAPVEEPVAPVEEPVAPVEEPAAPVEEPAAPVEEPKKKRATKTTKKLVVK